MMAESERPASPRRRRKPKRPNFVLVIVVGLFFGVGLSAVRWVAESSLGRVVGGIVGFVALAVLVGTFRLVARVRRRWGVDEDYSPERIREWFEDSALGPPTFEGDGTLVGAPVLVMSQRTKAIEAVTEYRVFDHRGATLALITQIGQGRLKKIVRVLFWFEIFMTHRFDVRSADGTPLGTFVRPRKFFRSRIELYDAHGRTIGTIRQENIFFHIRFALHAADGTVVGRIRADNWRAWDFTITDDHGETVARMVKVWEGYARTLLTAADRFVVSVQQPLLEPLRTLTVAGALAIDVALKQDSRGMNSLSSQG
jgi:uncharacterized protein YxjI